LSVRVSNRIEPTIVGLCIFLVGAAVFVLITGNRLPPLVASNFGADGAANAFMSRAMYLTFMLVGTVAIPVLIVFPQRMARTIPPRFINVPNRDYWVAPERIDATLGYLRDHAVWFVVLFVAFLGFVHWEVVQANLRHPAILAVRPFATGLILYVAGMLLWIYRLIARFRPPSDATR
jgi:hypothetical protein